MTLAEHLAARNAEIRAWVAEDPENRWAGLLTEDLAHWAECGVYTLEQFERYELENLVWEMYKDAMGFRPRHMDFKSMTDEELRAEVDSLSRMIERQIQEDAKREAEALAYAYEDALEEDKQRSERPEPIDYVAANHQDGWL